MNINKILDKFQKGEKELAYNLLNQHIIKEPNDLIALYNFAYMSEILNFQEIAIKKYLYINKKDIKNWKSRFNLYLIFIKKKKFKEALKLINQVLKIQTNYQPALRDRALTNYKLGKYNEALKDALNSVNLNNKDYIALNVLGITYGALNENLKAKEIFIKAIKLNGSYAPSYNNFGNCILNLGDVDLALSNCLKSLKIDPEFEEAINNIANIFLIKGKYKEAIDYYWNALRKGADEATIYYNIGVAYTFLKKFEKAEKYYNKSFKINPDDEILKKNYSILYLAKQEYKKAWQYYDARLNLNDFVQKNKNISFTIDKIWHGEKILKNEKLLIIKEQGIGDEIVFSSMYPDLIKAFPNCKIETEKRLLSIFQRSFDKNNNIIPYLKFSNSREHLKEFNKVIYAGSLGKMFRNNLSDFPKSKFLNADINKIKTIRKQLSAISKKPKIGITWESKRKIYGQDKSITLNLLKPILNLKTFDFINLQYGDTSKEIKDLKKLKIHTIKNIDLYNDFESIAALLLNLDLFITISNSTAHLAGALGVPTFLIKPKNHSVFFYWNVPGDISPWYPSIKLFQYNTSWEETIDIILKELVDNFNPNL